jgi:hypothetical protein
VGNICLFLHNNLGMKKVKAAVIRKEHRGSILVELFLATQFGFGSVS